MVEPAETFAYLLQDAKQRINHMQCFPRVKPFDDLPIAPGGFTNAAPM